MRTRSRLRFGVGMVSLLGVTLAGCATLSSSGSQGGATVVVQNQANVDARIYLLQGGHQAPLGMVTGMGNTTITIPQTLLESEMERFLLADAIGSSAWFKSGPLNIGPGDEVVFVIAPNLSQSSVSVGG